ncbi:MAG TPA: excinuclease ABC subunit A, partial [Planctomycetaceae bacterium]|nr:excinuclease ABC subunit A [Planctomycetaceae bacterium]
RKIAGDLLHEATSRLSFLVEVGLHYLTLARTLPTLSGGETQRIRLAGQIGRALTGVLYVLDEPTIGLHPSDNGRLLTALERLRDLGNTIVMVEHDREVLRAADWLYDFGPGAGKFGGTITDSGAPKLIGKSDASLTGKYLSDREQIIVPEVRRCVNVTPTINAPVEEAAPSKRRKKAAPKVIAAPAPTPPGEWLELIGARQNNLRNVDLRIPLAAFTAITGVSGSGKSSLIEDTLAKAIARKLNRSSDQPGPYDELRGLEHLSKLIVVDQQPLGNTPASNPATYTGVFEEMRELFARLPDSKVRGYRPARFSFNRPGGRCEACEGNGQKKIEMHFLPDVWVECDECRGQRYNTETLGVKFHGKSIADVLAMSIGEALELFHNLPKIRGPLAVLAAIGLDYLTLGQPAPTLSGGEAQRVKLAAELAKPQSGRTLYLLDEPTTGLHFDDIRKLLKILNSLVDAGNTVVVIEHNLDVIKTADWIVDLGPHAGSEGGYIVAQGTPEDIVGSPGFLNPGSLQPMKSLTAECLAPVLASGRRGPRESFDPQSVLKKRSGDMDVAKIGKEIRMPWEVDGRKWHLRERLARTGKPARWDGRILETVIDAIEATEGFAPVNWNAQYVVEAIGTRKGTGWFLHAHTGEEWYTTLNFRVAKNAFDEDELSATLNLTDFDDLDDMPVYGRQARVRVRAAQAPWHEVVISLYKLEEVESPAFQSFLKEAIQSYLEAANPEKLNLEDLTPWKKLGRKWHVMRKGFLQGKIAWDVEVIEGVFSLLDEVWPEAKVDWSGKVLVNYRRGKERLGVVVSKRPAGVDLELIVPSGSVPLGRVTSFGIEPRVEPGEIGLDKVCLRFTTVEQVRLPALRTFLQALFKTA